MERGPQIYAPKRKSLKPCRQRRIRDADQCDYKGGCVFVGNGFGMRYAGVWVFEAEKKEEERMVKVEESK